MNNSNFPNDDKLAGIFKLKVMAILSVFDFYGLGIHIPEAAAQILTLAQELHLALNGKDIPIGNDIHYPKK